MDCIYPGVSLPNCTQLIQGYLGITLNEKFRYLVLYLHENSFSLSTIPDPLDSDLNVKLFRQVVRVLKSDKPLRLLAEIQKEMLGDPFVTHLNKVSVESQEEISRAVLKNVSLNAEIITAIFMDRVMPLQTVQLNYHRLILATNLKWHMRQFLGESKLPKKNKVSFHLDLPKQEESKPPRRTSGSLQSSSSPRSLGHGLHSAFSSSGSTSPRRRKISLASDQEALLRMLSMENLHKCRLYWIGFSQNQVPNTLEWNSQEYELIRKSGLLGIPSMHLLVQQELRDVLYGINPQVLIRDIIRNLFYITIGNAKGHHVFQKLLCVSASEEEIVDNKSVFDLECNRAYHLIIKLLEQLGEPPNGKDSISKKWRRCIKKESDSGITSESTFKVIKKFYSGLNRTNLVENQLVILLSLLRQKMYVHPVMVIINVFGGSIPLEFENDDPDRSMGFRFLEKHVEFCTSMKAIPSKDARKWPSRKIGCSAFKIEIMNRMHSVKEDLSAWASELEIIIHTYQFSKEKKKKFLIPEDVQRLVIHPLCQVGFKVRVEATEAYEG